MDEQKQDNLRVISGKEPLYTDTFTVEPNPTPTDIVNTLARMAKFSNAYIAEALRSGVITAANPATAALMNSSATLEQGALQLQQILAQRSGFAGGPPPAGPMPFRTN